MIKDKVVLVTGGAKGIGASVIRKFAQQNYRVIINYNTSEQEAYKLQKELDDLKCQALVIKADITKQEEVDEMLAIIIRKFKRIDVLVNNASIAIDTLFQDKTIDNFKKTIDTNLIAPFYLSQRIGEMMYEQKEGIIINISSTNGIDKYFPMSIDYDASKAALISLTHNLAFQFAPFVRVNCVAPGFIETDMTDILKDEIKDEITKNIPLKRVGTAKDVANVVKFLASGDSSYITGQVLQVDGGMLM